MRTLIIDDSQQGKILARVMQNRHPEDTFRVAQSLARGRMAIWEETFDVMAFDIMLPADDNAVPGSSENAGLVSGIQLLDLVRTAKNCPNAETPVIFLSGVPPEMDSRIQKAKLEHEGRYLQKPIAPDDLYAALQAAATGGGQQ